MNNSGEINLSIKIHQNEPWVVFYHTSTNSYRTVHQLQRGQTEFQEHSTSNENQNKVSPKSYVIHITLLLFSVCSFAIPLSPKNYIHFILYSLRLTLALLLICNISHKRCNEQNTIDQDLLNITRRYLQMGQVIQSFKIIFWQRRDSIILQFSAKKRE